MSTFDEIAARQGWNADSRETVLRTYISLDSDRKPASLEEFAQSVADTENGPVLKVPPLQMDVVGEYTGNAYPKQEEYRVHMVEEVGTDNCLLSIEDSAGNEVIETLTLTPELIDGIQKIALTDHSLGGYADDWKIPDGMDRTVTWTLGDASTFIALSSGHIDEIAAWLRFATGEEEWDGGDEWEY